MSRTLRLDFAGAWHHVMNRGAGHRAIFRSNDDRRSFLALLEHVHERFSTQIHAYCLMDTHYHLLVHTPTANLGESMRQLGGMHTQRFNYHNGIDGPLFRGRYKSIVIDADNYLLAASRYIHRNPVEAGMVGNVEDHPWSSFGAYTENDPCPPWLFLGPTLLGFGRRSPRTAYRSFVEARPPSENPNDLYDNRLDPQILGSAEFIRSITDNYR